MRKSKEIKVGNVLIGGNNPITVQSMTNTDTADFNSTFNQIVDLQNAGCDIVRLAVNNDLDVESCKKLLTKVSVPLVADIQFDYRLAIKCSDIGFSKVRFNPGNIGSTQKVKELVDACKSNKTTIRIGVNSGSLDKKISSIYGFGADAMFKSVEENVRLLENLGFYDIILSAKSSSVSTTIETYRKLSTFEYPLHVGVTESGYSTMGLIKSAIGIGSLLNDGVGDTIRVSLTGNPVNEVYAGKDILKSLGLLDQYCEIVSCPTCSRCKYDLESIVKELTIYTKDVKKKLKIAAMGCVVNGPGEAKDADFGFAGGANGEAVVFVKGNIVKKIKYDEIISEMKRMVDEFWFLH